MVGTGNPLFFFLYFLQVHQWNPVKDEKKDKRLSHDREARHDPRCPAAAQRVQERAVPVPAVPVPVPSPPSPRTGMLLGKGGGDHEAWGAPLHTPAPRSLLQSLTYF